MNWADKQINDDESSVVKDNVFHPMACPQKRKKKFLTLAIEIEPLLCNGYFERFSLQLVNQSLGF